MSPREPAVRVTVSEILGIDEEAEARGEDKTKYGLSELGLTVNRFLVAAKFVSKMSEDERTIIRVKDSFNEISLYLGEYYKESLEALEELEEGDNVIAIGKLWIGDSKDYFSKKFYADSISKVTEQVRKYAEAKAVSFLNDRIKKISKAISSGIREEDELSILMESKRVGYGLAQRFKLKNSVDIEKFSSIVDSYVAQSVTGIRETILDEMKKFREISMDEMAERLEGKVTREELEENIRNLLLDGEIMEIKTGVFKYIP